MFLTSETLGAVSVALFVVAYAPYFYSIYKQETKPHPYSWSAWGLLLAVTFLIQISEGAGPGAWGTGIVALLQLSVAAIGWIRRENVIITRSDTVSFVAALISLVLWLFANSPLLAILLITAVDILGYWPTLHKTYNEPYSDNLLAYSISTVALLCSILAIETFNAITATEPFAFLFMNILFVLAIGWRRHARKRL